MISTADQSGIEPEVSREAEKEVTTSEVEKLRVRLWGDSVDDYGGRLDPVYCSTFLHSKIARLTSSNPFYTPPDLASPSIFPFLPLLQPSLGRPPRARLPATSLSNSPFPPQAFSSTLSTTTSPSLVPSSTLSSENFPVPIDNETQQVVKYLYGRSLNQTEMEYLEKVEPSFSKFVETMKTVAEINRKVVELDTEEGEREAYGGVSFSATSFRGGGGGERGGKFDRSESTNSIRRGKGRKRKSGKR